MSFVIELPVAVEEPAGRERETAAMAARGDTESETVLPDSKVDKEAGAVSGQGLVPEFGLEFVPAFVWGLDPESGQVLVLGSVLEFGRVFAPVSGPDFGPAASH